MPQEYFSLLPPLDAGKPFTVSDEITIFQAAMVYAGRHPHEALLAGGELNDYEDFLGKESRDESRRKSWDVYNELKRRVADGRIAPVRSAFLSDGTYDPIRTVISTVSVYEVAKRRGDARDLVSCLSPISETIHYAPGVALNNANIGEITQVDINEWYQLRVKCRPSTRPPTRKEDEEAARQHFGQTPRLRNMLRVARKEYGFSKGRGGRQQGRVKGE